jgi:hypothetical protein
MRTDSQVSRENLGMDVDYMLVCAAIWRETGDIVAGWELINGLKSRDLCVRQIAKDIMLESGKSSMNLLESAFAVGSVTPDSAGACITEIFRAQAKEDWTNWEPTSN